MLEKFYYIDPGTGGLVVSNLWQYILMFIGFILSFFIGISKSTKKAVHKLWQMIKSLL